MEKELKPISGWLMLLFEAIMLAIIIISYFNFPIITFLIISAIAAVIFFFTMGGFIAVEPNSSRVLNLFGKYTGTVKHDGFYWVNPLFTRKKISLRAYNLDTKPIKVNDKQGNPIMIGAVVVWKVENTYKAAFDVDNYHTFIETQSEAAIRKLAGSFSYDNWEDEDATITLRSSSAQVNQLLDEEVSERLTIAGINVIETRISHLAYATEIAGAMLQRQQATAIVAARTKIVEGAVGMVEMALEALAQKDIVNLDEEKKAAMVSNLLVVLCSERTTPVVNAGTLYQ